MFELNIYNCINICYIKLMKKDKFNHLINTLILFLTYEFKLLCK
jgi:hypothetical protein